MKIGDEVHVHGYIDEIRNDVVIIRNKGGYFGTVAEEILLTGIKALVAEQTEPSNRIVEEQPTPIRNFMVNQTEPTTEDCSMVADCSWK